MAIPSRRDRCHFLGQSFLRSSWLQKSACLSGSQKFHLYRLPVIHENHMPSNTACPLLQPHLVPVRGAGLCHTRGSPGLLTSPADGAHTSTPSPDLKPCSFHVHPQLFPASAAVVLHCPGQLPLLHQLITQEHRPFLLPPLVVSPLPTWPGGAQLLSTLQKWEN